MPVQWSEIYDTVCEILLEPSGLQLGLLTDAQFLQIAGEILTEFLALTGIVKKIFNMPAQVGIPTYSEPSQLGELECVNVGQSYCYRTSGYFLDNNDPNWASFNGSPEDWREDELSPQTLQIVPAPNVIGDQVVIPAGQGAYGTVSATSNAVDFDLKPDLGQQGYGTISACGGAPYVEAINPGYGVLSAMVASTNNVQMIGSALPYNITDLTLFDYVEGVPDSFAPYLKYGILARIFDSDSELRDELKAKYCRTRYREGISLAQAIMCEPATTQ